MHIRNSILIAVLTIMAGTAVWHSYNTYEAAAGYRQCLYSQPGARKGITRLVFANHSEWLKADNACKPY